MVALTRVRRGFHLAQQGVHFRRAQYTARTHRTVAGHGAANLGHTFFERQGRAMLGQVVGNVADKALHIGIA